EAGVNIGGGINADAAQHLSEPASTSAAGDLDGDGFDDLVAGTGADAPASLHLNLENPTSLHPTLAESPGLRRGLSTVPLSIGEAAENVGIALADFDLDGELDLVIVNGPGAAAELFLNDGAGVLTSAATFGDPNRVRRSVVAADLDGDGYPDLA